MKKIKLQRIRFIVLITLINCLHAQLDFGGELYIRIIGGQSFSMTLQAQGSVYGDYDLGYPEVEDYDYYSTYSNYLLFDFLHTSGADTIAYSLYKLTLSHNGPKVIYFDFKDCDYWTGEGSGYSGSDVDMNIRYYPNQQAFKVQNMSSGQWNWVNGNTVRIWEDGRKSEELPEQSCWGPPATPADFDVQLVWVGMWLKPKLTWTANTESDHDGYQLWRKINSGSWSVLVTLSAGATSYIDQGVFIGECGNHDYVYYKIKSFDWGPLYSPYSGQQTVRHGGSQDCGGPIPKALVGDGQVYVPEDYVLHQNYPNPFNPTTLISYALPEESFVELKIYDVLSHEVYTLISGYFNAGFQEVRWEGTNASGQPVPSGMYFYRLDAKAVESGERFHQTRKMVMMR